MTLRRRTALAAPLLAAWPLAGCGDGPAWTGGWVGSDPAHGHRLREAADDAAPGAAPLRRCAVAVVGAGIAGLAAARALLRAGVDDVRVFELEDQPGGNARGHVLQGLPCPLGAHYLPQPGPHANELAEWLHEIGLLRQWLGRTWPDERHLCHAPQERLWIEGDWVEGLLPPAAPGSPREAAYRRFEADLEAVSRRLAFALPSRRAAWTPAHAELDAQTFATWLDARGHVDPALRWWLDYSCRDDYGAAGDTVSAWAGLHYFASRHGLHAPGSGADDAPGGVFTWPEGNAWLVRRLAAALGDRLATGAMVRRVRIDRHGVELTLPGARWQASQVVLALPLHVAARVLQPRPSALVAAARALPHAPWLVANLWLHEPLTDKPGAAPAWDNVLFDPTRRAPASLGYVRAQHQSLARPRWGPEVVTAYWALDRRDRGALLSRSWRDWTAAIVDELALAHPDLPRKLRHVSLTRHGHAMAIPVPGLRSSAALQALADGSHGQARLHLAHSDLAAYSVFEEAFTLGDAAGRAAARAVARGPA